MVWISFSNIFLVSCCCAKCCFINEDIVNISSLAVKRDLLDPVPELILDDIPDLEYYEPAKVALGIRSTFIFLLNTPVWGGERDEFKAVDKAGAEEEDCLDCEAIFEKTFHMIPDKNRLRINFNRNWIKKIIICLTIGAKFFWLKITKSILIIKSVN